MTDPAAEHDRARDEELVGERAALLPEEETAGGSVDAERQAEEILADSLRRTDDPEGTQQTSVQGPTGDRD
ncbi:hypothetical protein GC722_11790 [Auraticoccus sp. F435]|uniref:Uncharacterized protein n=1 Tax=Auraticoccus cholistanensis TaxID=2656650 RepID=A0A6A9V130_9ACTN|nr:hypothetical protein [Auraticoccus cholistanensis]MVA76699.1 hypothetical protein [Auraticoccus cholistanensis]